MTSKKQKNAGFLLPADVSPPDTICVKFFIPDATEYRNAVRGHLYELAKWWAWEKSGEPDDRRATDAAAIFRRLLLDTLVFGNCDTMSFELRQSDLNPCLLEQSIDGGVTWTPAFDYGLCKVGIEDFSNQVQNENKENERRAAQYNGTPGSIHVDAPSTWTGGSGGVDALCSAVKAYVDAQVLRTLNNYRIAAGLGAIGASLLGMGGILFAIIGGVFEFIIGLALSDIEAAAGDRPALDAIICELKSALGTGSVTEAAFQAAINGLTGADHNEDTIIAILKGNMGVQVNYLWFLEMLGAAQQPTAAGALSDCPCDDVWCYLFDFQHYGIDAWQAYRPSELGYSMTYTPGEGIIGTNNIDTITNPDLAYHGVAIYVPFTVTRVTRVEVVYEVTKGTSNAPSTPAYQLSLNTAQVQAVSFAAETNGIHTRVWTGSVNATQCVLYYRASRDTSAPYSWGGSLKVRSIKMSGTGINPFGIDNC